MSLKYSVEQIYGDYKTLLINHKWNSTASKRAAKAGIAVFVSVLIADKLNLGMPFWAAMAAIFTMQASTTISSFRIGLLYRAGGTLFGALIGFVLLGLIIQNYPLMYIAIFISLTISFYLRYRSEHTAFWVLVGLTIFMVILIGNDSTPVYTATFTFFRCIEIIIGASTACLVDILIWPEHASAHYRTQLDLLKINYCDVLKHSFLFYFENKEYDYDKCTDMFSKLNLNFQKIKKLYTDASLEHKFKHDENSFTEINISSIHNDMEELKEFIERTKFRPKYKYHFIYENDLIHIFQLLETYHKKERLGLIDSSKYILQKIRKCIFDLEQSFASNKKLGVHKKYDPIEIFVFYEYVSLLKSYIALLRNVSEYKYKIKKPVNNINEKFSNPLYKSDFAEINFFKKQYFIHKPTLKYSIQGSLIILFVVWLWKFLEIPGDNLSIAVAVFVVVLPETSACYTKGLMRFIGCAIGGATGFLFLALQIENTALMCLLTFCAIYMFAYLQTGGPNISYLGRQAAYGFVIAVFPYLYPATDLENIITRFIGIFFGIACVWTLRWFFWNDDIQNNFNRHMTNIKKTFLSSFYTYRKLINAPQSNIAFVNLDTSSAIVSLKVLMHSEQIDKNEGKLLMNWLDNIQQLFYRYENLLNLNRKYFIATNNIDPKLISTLFKVTRNLANKNFISKSKLIESDLKELKHLVLDYPNLLREKWILHDASFTEKHSYIHTYVIIKRLYRRLSKIFILQNELQRYKIT